MHHLASTLMTRRALLAGAAATGAVLGPVAGGPPRRAEAQSALSPDQALERLVAGNARFVAGQLQSFTEDLALLKQNNAEKQEPFAAVLSCADSRVPVEILFDQTIGHVFVTRVAGNIATPEIIGSLEYGVAVLGCRVLMVLGHGSCGAVSATMANKAVPGQISSLYVPIRAAVDEGGNNLDATIRANARIQARRLREGSPVFAGAVAQNQLRVVAAHYDIANGQVSLL